MNDIDEFSGSMELGSAFHTAPELPIVRTYNLHANCMLIDRPAKKGIYSIP